MRLTEKVELSVARGVALYCLSQIQEVLKLLENQGPKLNLSLEKEREFASAIHQIIVATKMLVEIARLPKRKP